ncbi:hypothetical protein ACCO45_002908 [Purpureocillium lilacinum]
MDTRRSSRCVSAETPISMPQEDRGQYRTPCMGPAAENGYISMVKPLLKNGVNANITDIGYRTALSCAAENGYDAMSST